MSRRLSFTELCTWYGVTIHVRWAVCTILSGPESSAVFIITWYYNMRPLVSLLIVLDDNEEPDRWKTLVQCCFNAGMLYAALAQDWDMRGLMYPIRHKTLNHNWYNVLCLLGLIDWLIDWVIYPSKHDVSTKVGVMLSQHYTNLGLLYGVSWDHTWVWQDNHTCSLSILIAS